ncbi:PepSY domain-containing protein [Streptosporangium sp. NPDC001681]|uniref:PepSY domain-containing protein n=1 Tax=Streptosporangium sp. NPDC001681 TaxID=3154395 RepID=UPI00332EA39E
MRNTTKLTIAATGLLAVIAGGGAVASAGTTTPTPAPSGTATTPAPVNPTPDAESTPAPGEAAAEISRDEAVRIAQEKVPGAKLVKVEFDGDETPANWEVELREGDVEHDFDVDAATGAILEQDREAVDDDADDSASDDNATNGRDDHGNRDDRDDRDDHEDRDDHGNRDHHDDRDDHHDRDDD